MIDSATETVNSLTQFNAAVLAYIPSVIGIAAIVARFFPPQEGDGFASKAHKFINWLAQNSGHAENKQK